MGDEGTLAISESESRGSAYREAWVDETKWDKWVKKGYLYKQCDCELECLDEAKLDCIEECGCEQMLEEDTGISMDVRESPKPPKYDLPVSLDKPFHQPHLENFFAAIRDKSVKLNCPAEVGYESAVTVLKVNEAIAAGKKLEFKPEEFKA